MAPTITKLLVEKSLEEKQWVGRVYVDNANKWLLILFSSKDKTEKYQKQNQADRKVLNRREKLLHFAFPLGLQLLLPWSIAIYGR